MAEESNINKALRILSLMEEERDDMYTKDELRNQIIHGDCLEVMRRIPKGSVDIYISDPPWGVDHHTFREKFKNDKIINDKLEDFNKLMKDFPFLLHRVLKDSGVAYVFAGGTSVITRDKKSLFWGPMAMAEKFFNAGFVPLRLIIWDKISIGRMLRYRTRIEFIIYFVKRKTPTWTGEGKIQEDYIQMPEEYIYLEEDEIIKVKKVHGSKKLHIAEKPVSILSAFIENSSLPGDLVLDSFAGSGPLVEACKQTGRDFLLIELEEKNVDIIRKREKQLTVSEVISKSKMEQKEMGF